MNYIVKVVAVVFTVDCVTLSLHLPAYSNFGKHDGSVKVVTSTVASMFSELPRSEFKVTEDLPTSEIILSTVFNVYCSYHY